MSALRLSRPGYPTQLVNQGPAFARVQGYNGSAIGTFSGTTLLPRVKSNNEHQREQHRQAASRYRERQRCGEIMPLIQEPCYRTRGHKDCHRSRAVMETDNQMRRANRPHGWSQKGVVK